MFNIYVLDDTREHRDMLRIILEDVYGAGVKVETFSCADDLISRIRMGERPDLIFTDYRMPGKDGLNVAKELRGFNGSQMLYDGPMILLTADMITAEQAASAGINRVIRKPYELDDIVNAVVLEYELAEGLHKNGE